MDKLMSELITLWNHSNDAFLILDNQSRILYANSILEQLSGLDIKIHIDRSIKDLLKNGFISNPASLQAIQKKKTVTSVVKTSAGKTLLSTATPVIDPAGNISRIIVNLRSMSIIRSLLNDNNVIYREKSEHFSYYLESIDNTKYELVFKSKKMVDVVEMAYRLSSVDSTVLVLGETGVGKELIARFIHNHSKRGKAGEFIKINCAAIPENLVESELFGYERGSFTGALKNGKPGLIELANGGTLFLDEIAELPFGIQAKLLTVLQDKEYFKVGSVKPSPIDVRIIAATNQNLAEMVEEKKFRKDLFYRLNVIPINVPPLRERRQDIPVLISHYSSKFREKFGINKEIDPEVLDYLYWYNWPGNVRELECLIERLLITIPNQKITLSCLPEPYFVSGTVNRKTLKEMVEEFELELIRETIEQCKNNTEAARNLGISVASLFRKMKKLKYSGK